MKTKSLLIAILLGLSLGIQAQELKVKCDAYTNEGFTEDITLTIHVLGSQGVPNVLEDVSKHKLYFEPREEYLLTYEKEGYVTKTIHIVSPRHLSKDLTIEFDVLLMPQPVDDKEVVYSSPVGRIFFSGANTMKYEKVYEFIVLGEDVLADK